MEFIKITWDYSNAVLKQSSIMTDRICDSIFWLADGVIEIFRTSLYAIISLYQSFLSSALIPDLVINIFDAN